MAPVCRSYIDIEKKTTKKIKKQANKLGTSAEVQTTDEKKTDHIDNYFKTRWETFFNGQPMFIITVFANILSKSGEHVIKSNFHA